MSDLNELSKMPKFEDHTRLLSSWSRIEYDLILVRAAHGGMRYGFLVINHAVSYPEEPSFYPVEGCNVLVLFLSTTVWIEIIHTRPTSDGYSTMICGTGWNSCGGAQNEQSRCSWSVR